MEESIVLRNLQCGGEWLGQVQICGIQWPERLWRQTRVHGERKTDTAEGEGRKSIVGQGSFPSSEMGSRVWTTSCKVVSLWVDRWLFSLPHTLGDCSGYGCFHGH